MINIDVWTLVPVFSAGRLEGKCQCVLLMFALCFRLINPHVIKGLKLPMFEEECSFLFYSIILISELDI